MSEKQKQPEVGYIMWFAIFARYCSNGI